MNLQRLSIFKKVFAILSSAVLATQFAFATPLPALFYASSFDVNVGDTLTFDLKVNPAAGSPVYTVGATLKYDPVTLQYSDASVDKAWLPLSRAPYEVTDTTSGTVTRTAGYPQGLTGTAPFTHYVFKAIAPGDTKVVITQGMALDADNNDSGLQVKTIAIHVHGKETPTPTTETPAPAAKKAQPQTVNLEISGPTAFYSDETYSFGIQHGLKVAQDTTGTTSISVFDQNGQEVYTSDQNFTMATDTNLTYEIPANAVQPGDYTIVATSKYDNQKSPTTAKKDIGVLARAEKTIEKTNNVPYIPLYVWIGIGFLIFIILLMILYNRSKAFRRFIKNF